MKQLVQNYRSGEMRVDDVPTPQLRPDGVLVRNAVSVISAGTERALVDLARKNLFEKARARPELARKVLDKARTEGVLTAYRKAMQRLDTASALGYSSSGTVVEVGNRVPDLRAGMPVACAGIGYASHAEVVYVPRHLVAPVPPGVSLADAGFTTIGAVAMHGVRSAGVALGETVAVMGLGLVGLFAVQVLKAAGCLVGGLDPDVSRCQLALEFGADEVTSDAREMHTAVARLSKGLMADTVLITAASESDGLVVTAAEIARDRAPVVVVGQIGLRVPRKLFYEKELSLLLSRSYGPGRYDRSYEEQGVDYPAGYVRWTENRNMVSFLDLLASRKVRVDRLVTHEFPIEKAPQAYDVITGRRAESHLAVVLKYRGPAEDTAFGASAAAAERIHVTIPTEVSDDSRPGSLPRVRVGVIGAGTFSSGVLLPALRQIDNASVRAVCSQGGLAARDLADRVKAEYCCSRVEDVFCDHEIDAVVIATRPDSHASLVCAAMEAGKHVFVEKPLATDRKGLEAITGAREMAPNRLVMMVGFNRRFSPFLTRLQQFFSHRSGPFVATYRVSAGALPPGDWQLEPDQGGGRIVGECGHFVDALSFLAGRPPVEVYGRAMDSHDGAARENAVLVLSFADGSIGTITYLTVGAARFPKERLEVFADGATGVIDDFRRLELVREGKRVHRGWFAQDKGHIAEMRAFVNAVARSNHPPVAFDDYVLMTLATLQAVESFRTGRPEPVVLAAGDLNTVARP